MPRECDLTDKLKNNPVFLSYFLYAVSQIFVVSAASSAVVQYSVEYFMIHPNVHKTVVENRLQIGIILEVWFL
jgi:hypothetical protein